MKIGDPTRHVLFEFIVLDVLIFKEYDLPYHWHLIFCRFLVDRILICIRVDDDLFILVLGTSRRCGLFPRVELLIIAASSRIADHAESKCLVSAALASLVALVVTTLEKHALII